MDIPVRRDSMDRMVAERDSERVPHYIVPGPVLQATLSPGDPLPHLTPISMPISNPFEPGSALGECTPFSA